MQGVALVLTTLKRMRAATTKDLPAVGVSPVSLRALTHSPYNNGYVYVDLNLDLLNSLNSYPSVVVKVYLSFS